ncbi:MAG: alpha/beta fold hydrolase [Bacteroidota bacterium]
MNAARLLSLIAIFAAACGNDPQEHSSPHQHRESPSAPVKVSFAADDSLQVTAHLYHLSPDAPSVVLCHQLHYNKAEYREIAQALRAKGFNCLAIDQRVGGPMDSLPNETALEANKTGKPAEQLDALKDIHAAVNFMAAKYGRPVILWGSSYSATLALYAGTENPNVRAMIVFSPGDYYADSKGSLRERLAELNKPLFATSSKEEAPELSAMLSAVKNKALVSQFIPASRGQHGSRALWTSDENHGEYWAAITIFLENIK